MNKYINKILIVLLILCCVPMLFGEMISKREKKNRKGQKVIIERYRNEADGLIKVEKTLVAENRMLANYYYKNNPEGIEQKEIDSKKNILQIEVITYKNNPKGRVKELKKYNFIDNQAEILLFFQENQEDGIYKEELITDINGKNGKDILYYKGRKDKISKQIRLLKDGKYIKLETYYLTNDNYLKNEFAYFINYEKEIYERIERTFADGNPKGQINEVLYFGEDGNDRTEKFFKNRPDGLIKHINFYENDVLVKTISYFENGERGEAFYKNGKIDRGTLYNPDGSIKREDKF